MSEKFCSALTHCPECNPTKETDGLCNSEVNEIERKRAEQLSRHEAIAASNRVFPLKRKTEFLRTLTANDVLIAKRSAFVLGWEAALAEPTDE